ncbi:PREDICTED: uncharacterized protein LOC108756554 [Trachymyrmex septentrionalis]|uniref:uncharacterized protein LOC108756554 n=1 Tax=Trachymyrmex septentrionalis TaxID=34720 RepID=UPI00084F415E|nr:PREDICTED: uncharacterized protein LOC108756554 [Trachymyrmex septentrionalis]
MVLFQFFTTTILLLSLTSVKTYSVPYQNIQLAFSITPKLMYTSESNPTFSGYSYTTQDFNGGESNVVFTTGADSMNRLKNEINSMKISEGYSQKEKDQDNIKSSEQSKSVKAEENKIKQNLNSNIEVLDGEKKFSKNLEADNLIEHQSNLQQVSFIDVSYPTFRENLLNLHLPEFSRYQVSNVIQNQYYPYNLYTRLQLPLNNFDFYNPTVPLFYQTAPVISDSNSKSTSTATENTKASVESYTKSSQTNTTSSESNSVKSHISRFNLESTTNAIEQTSLEQSATSTKKLESSSERIREEITTSESTVTSQKSVEEITDKKANSTEFANTETSLLAEKSNTAI